MLSGPLTLEEIEAFTPGRTIAVEEAAGALGLSRLQAKLFRRIHGLDRIPYEPSLHLIDLVVPAARRVLRSVPDPELVRYVIYAHTSQAVAPALIDVAGVVRRRLGLDHAEAFAVTQQGCASGLAAIDAGGALLRAEGSLGDLALVVTGEKPFSRLSGFIADSSILGEAATCCLVRVNGRGDRIRSYVTRNLGQYCDTVRVAPEPLKEFRVDYPPTLAAVIDEAVRTAGLRLADIDLIIPHNVNRWTWLLTLRELGIDASGIFLDNIPRYSHCFCSDPFLNYVTLRAAGRLRHEAHYVLVSVGLGATFGAMVIQHSAPRSAAGATGSRERP